MPDEQKLLDIIQVWNKKKYNMFPDPTRGNGMTFTCIPLDMMNFLTSLLDKSYH